MHPEARAWVEAHIEGTWPRVLDIGGRDLNGSVRDLFPKSFYWTIDLRPGPGVDEVADALVWEPPEPFDLVLCLEVFEHTPYWPEILDTIHESLREGGRTILTMATDPRPPHSGIAATDITRGEWYGNISPAHLTAELGIFSEFVIDVLPGGDLRAVATR